LILSRARNIIGALAQREGMFVRLCCQRPGF